MNGQETAVTRTRRMLMAALIVASAALQGCAPEVGSDAWCDEMSEKPKGDWTANQAKDYAKHCILR